MNYKTISLSLLACMASVPAFAHDAWIEVNMPAAVSAVALTPEKTSLLDMSFFIGHAGDSEAYPIYANRISNFHSAGPNGLINHLNVLTEQTPSSHLKVSLASTGTHVVSLNTFRSYLELDASKFNDYAKEEGITPIIRARAANGSFNALGKESYSRHLKTIINYEANTCLEVRATQPTGQLFEIIPLSIISSGDGQKLTVEVQYRGEPTAGVTLHMNDINAGKATELIRTDSTGKALLNVPRNHDWYLHAAWSEFSEDNNEKADFLTVFASLSIAQLTSNREICFKSN